MLRTRRARGKMVRTEMGNEGVAEVSSCGPSRSVAERRTRRLCPSGSLMTSEGLQEEEREARTKGKVRPKSG